MSALDPLTPEQLAAHFFECHDPKCETCQTPMSAEFGAALMAQLKANIEAMEARGERDD